MHFAVLVTLLSSWYLVGLAVTVATNVYPSFDFVDEDKWETFHTHHSNRISWAVGVAWTAQAVGLALWLFTGPRATFAMWILCALCALGAVGLTIFSAVPIHQKLSQGFDSELQKRLRTAHMLRTISWVLGALFATMAMLQVL